MVTLKQYIIVLSSFVTGALIEQLGGWDSALESLFFFILVDYITGLLKGIKLRKMSSYIGFRGIGKKIGLLLMVAVAAKMDTMFNTGSEMFRNSAITAYILNELLSIIENLGEIGVYIPDPIRNFIDKLKKK